MSVAVHKTIVKAGVDTTNTTRFFFSPGTSQFLTKTGQPVPGVMQPDARNTIGTLTIPTTPEQDLAIQDFINQQMQNQDNYDLNDRKCTTTVRDALDEGGLNTPERILPRTLFNNLRKQFGTRP